MKSKGAVRLPGNVRAVMVATVLLATGCFILSFTHLFTNALGVYGWWQLAALYGLLIEGFVSISTYVAWVVRGTRSALYAWILTAGVFLYSAWANTRDAANAGEFATLVLPVVLLPLAVHLLIILAEHARQQRLAELAELRPATPEPVVITERVPVEVTPDNVAELPIENPRAVGYRLLAESADRPQQKAHFENQYRKALAA